MMLAWCWHLGICYICLNLLKAYIDWYEFSKHQRELSIGFGSLPSLDELSEQMRHAEIEVSIAMASSQALSLVRQRIEMLENDRQKKFEILQEMVMEICLREMDFSINLLLPEKDAVLVLPDIKSALGLFEPALDLAGESNPTC